MSVHPIPAGSRHAEHRDAASALPGSAESPPRAQAPVHADAEAAPAGRAIRVDEGPAIEAVPGAAPHVLALPARGSYVVGTPPPSETRREPGGRRGLFWAAATAAMLVPANGWFPSREVSEPGPAVDITARPSTDAVTAPLPPTPRTTALPGPVAITPEPTVAALMQQAIGARDPAVAAVAYARAAIRGSPRAAWFLGQLNETGTGVAPSPGAARLWYAASDLPAPQRRLHALAATGTTAGTPATPVPIFHARSDGSSDMVWHVPDGAMPVGFRVEALGPGGEALPPREVSVPALMLQSPVSAWRVTAIGADGSESAPSAMVRMTLAE